MFTYGNYIDEVLILTDSSDDDYYYVHDHLYSPATLVSSAGTVVERYEYDAFGEPNILDASYNKRASSNYANPYYLTGRGFDFLDAGNLVLGDYRNRQYNSYMGRFLTNDPLGITPNPQKPNIFDIESQYADGVNLYQYVESNPITNKDTYGLWCKGPIELKTITIRILWIFTYTKPLYYHAPKQCCLAFCEDCCDDMRKMWLRANLDNASGFAQRNRECYLACQGGNVPFFYY